MGDGMSSCNGECCRAFALPFTKEALQESARLGHEHNGSAKETQLIADMLIPLEGLTTTYGGETRYWFTCKHLDQQSGKCTIYEKRPVLCRQYPSKCSDPQLGCGLNAHCSYEETKSFEDHKKDFRIAWGIADDTLLKESILSAKEPDEKSE